MKRTIIVMMAALFLWTTIPMHVAATPYIKSETRADVIETHYRYHNGKLQYRHWNVTRGRWVEDDWIDL